MSSIIIAGAGLAAVAPILVVGGAIVAAGNEIYKGMEWLSSRELEEFKRLEEALRAPMPTHVTTKEERKRFQTEFRRAEAVAAKNPILKQHTEVVGRAIALGHSPFGQLVEAHDWKMVTKPDTQKGQIDRIFDIAAHRFTESNARVCTDAIKKAAIGAGFINTAVDQPHGDISNLVMVDDSGHSVVAKVRFGEDGSQIYLDLTGYSDGSCHPVMDKILASLADQNIRLGQVKRQSHYRPEGVLTVVKPPKAPKFKSVKSAASSAKQVKNDDRRRNQLHHQRSNQKIQ